MEPIVMRGHKVPEDVKKVLQGRLDVFNVSNPPDHDVPWFAREFRHECPGHRLAKQTGKPVSNGISLKEKYQVEGAYAIIYREGKCAACDQTARSRQGCVVETVLRPPLDGRVAR